MKQKVMMICPVAGTFNFRDQLIIKLRELDYDVILLSEDGPELKKYCDIGCRFEEISIDRRGTSIVNDIKLMLDYYHTIKKEKPNIVLLYTTKCSVYGGLVCRRLNIPYIVNNAGLIKSQGAFSLLLNSLYKIGFSGASCIMYQNDQERSVVQSLLHDKSYYRMIPGSGVDIDKYEVSEYPDDSNGIVFNFVARIMKSKGIEEYLECAKRIRKKYPHTRFRIYGSFDNLQYRSIIEEYNSVGIVEYCGRKTDMKPEIESSSAVIHPSYYEGMTNVVLEHSAMGRPCLGSNVSGVCDAIEDGKTGFVFQVMNVESLVEAVEKFISLPNSNREQMGRNAREKMFAEFDRRIVTECYLEEINRILN